MHFDLDTMKNVIVVSCISPATSTKFGAAWRLGATEAGCAVEHLIWLGEPPELGVSCASCQLGEQCSQADSLALAVQRLRGSRAVLFIVDEANAGARSPLLPLLHACRNASGPWTQPRYMCVLRASAATPSCALADWHDADVPAIAADVPAIAADVPVFDADVPVFVRDWAEVRIVDAGSPRGQEQMREWGARVGAALG